MRQPHLHESARLSRLAVQGTRSFGTGDLARWPGPHRHDNGKGERQKEHFKA